MTQAVSQIPAVLAETHISAVPSRTMGADFVSLTTTVLWALCLAVGVLGLWLPYPRPTMPAKPQEPVQVQIVKVDVVKPTPPPTETPMAPADAAPPAPEFTPPTPAPVLPAAPAAPPLTAVAAPSPAIAFALPVEGLTRVVDIGQASFARPARPATTGPTGAGGQGAPGNAPGQSGGAPGRAVSGPAAVTHLKIGEGEGRQPIPDYPHDAVAQRQEGTVGLRLHVDEDGRVTQVQAVVPCRWPLLNQAALRTVRERWRFNPGPPRVYEVAIQFQLNQSE